MGERERAFLSLASSVPVDVFSSVNRLALPPFFHLFSCFSFTPSILLFVSLFTISYLHFYFISLFLYFFTFPIHFHFLFLFFIYFCYFFR